MIEDTNTAEPPVAGRRVDAVVSRLRDALQRPIGEQDPKEFLEAIGELIGHAEATQSACDYVASIIERSHGDNVGFEEADVLRLAANQGKFETNAAEVLSATEHSPIRWTLAEDVIASISSGDSETATYRFMEWLSTQERAALLLRQAAESAIYRLSATADLKEMRKLTEAAIGGERIVVDLFRDSVRQSG